MRVKNKIIIDNNQMNVCGNKVALPRLLRRNGFIDSSKRGSVVTANVIRKPAK